MVLDNLVIITALVLGNQDGAELRALAFRSDNGRPAWSTLVARIPSPRQQAFTGNDFGFVAPSLCVHSGGASGAVEQRFVRTPWPTLPATIDN